MELTFILKAVRRYWWAMVACIAVGAIPLVMFDSTSEPYYESRAIILVSPPSESRVQVSFNSDPDRYVLSQLSVLRSESLAAQVATRVPAGTTTEVLESVAIEREPETDIVEIVSKAGDAERARVLAQTYLDIYFESLRAAVDETQLPELQRLAVDLDALRAQIAFVDASLAEAIAPYIPTPGVLRAGQSYPPIPGIDSVAPALVSQKAALLEEYNQVLETKTELELNSKLRVTSQIVQPATTPTTQLVDANRFIGLAGLLAGGFIGLLVCITLARLSRKSNDIGQTAQLLGGSLVGSFPSARGLAKSRRVAVEQLPNRAVALVDDLCVRAEANAEVGKALTVLVAGTERSSGTTTLAGAMANRYAANGSQVLLIDVDTRDPELTRLFAPGNPGIPGLLASNGQDATLPRRGRDGVRHDPFCPTGVPGLSVVGIGDKSSSSFRRQHVPDIIAIAARHAHVVVFDGGPMMDAAATVQLAQMVDAVVVAVPDRRQFNTLLTSIAAQIKGRRGELLVVSMPARRRRSVQAGPTAGQRPPASLDLAGEPDVRVSTPTPS